MVESTEMKIFKEETSAKILGAIMNAALSEHIEFRVTKWDILSNVISIIFRLCAVVFNGYLAYEYYNKGEIIFFRMTLGFIIIPAAISVILTITLHYEDSKNDGNKKKKGICELILFVVVFPYTLRFVQSLIYQVKCLRAEKNKELDRQRHFYKLMVVEESDVALIRIIECFLDACPHKIIHITAIIQANLQPTIFQLLSLTSAFTSFAWSLTAYSRCIRLAQPDKRQLSLAGMSAQCVWHFCVTLSRVLSIALLASIYPSQAAIFIASHAFVMTLWVFLLDRSPFCAYTSLHSFAFSMVIGAVLIFTYILPKEAKHTFSRYLFFYVLTGTENFICISVFVLNSSTSKLLVAMMSAVPVASFFVGIGAMIVYYKFLHPNILSRRDLMTEL